MKELFCILLVAFSVIVCNGQEILSPQPQAKMLTKFPFKQYSGGVMVIQARVNDIPDTLNFILDTGSGGISLDSTTCVEFGIKLTPSDTIITGMGGTHKVSFVFNQKIHLPGLTVDKLNFHVNDYDILSSVYGEKIDGIIGYSFFSRYIVKINFDSTLIEVYSPGEMEYPKQGSTIRPAFTTLPIQNLLIRDGRKINFNYYLDTGAGLCFLLNEDFAKDSNVLLSGRKPLLTQAEGLGGRLEMRLTVIKTLQVGIYKFRKVPTYLFKDEFNVTSYPYVGGLLGNDLLRRFNLIINYPKREFHLLPNGHFNDPFDYAYTGMAMYFINGRITIEDVITGSPADKAGLRKGDILLSVGKNITNNIMQYKTALQSASEKMKLVIMRENKLLEFFIKPKSIL